MVSRFDVAAGKADFPAMAQCARIMSHFPRGSETLINVRPFATFTVLCRARAGWTDSTFQYMGACSIITLACDLYCFFKQQQTYQPWGSQAK